MLIKVDYQEDGEGIWWGNDIISPARPIGPCAISDSGDVYFLKRENGKTDYSRQIGGPSMIHDDGNVFYTSANGECHRTDGPAIIWANGTKEYRINGVQIDSTEFFLTYGTM